MSKFKALSDKYQKELLISRSIELDVVKKLMADSGKENIINEINARTTELKKPGFILVYPITTGLAELATYFGYIMPRLNGYFKSQWIVIALPVLAFSLQHCTLPLVFETKFILFRGVMYLLFAFIYGIALYKRPSLLTWLAFLQLLIYILPMFMLLTISQ